METYNFFKESDIAKLETKSGWKYPRRVRPYFVEASDKAEAHGAAEKHFGTSTRVVCFKGREFQEVIGPVVRG